jgi:hypothetical protein
MAHVGGLTGRSSHFPAMDWIMNDAADFSEELGLSQYCDIATNYDIRS